MLPFRDYLSPSDIIATYPHLIVVGTGLAFGFLVVRRYRSGLIVSSYLIYLSDPQNMFNDAVRKIVHSKCNLMKLCMFYYLIVTMENLFW